MGIDYEVDQIYLRLLKYGWLLGLIADMELRVCYHPTRTMGWMKIKAGSILDRFGVFRVIERKTKEKAND
jgi:hypothetical protein